MSTLPHQDETKMADLGGGGTHTMWQVISDF